MSVSYIEINRSALRHNLRVIRSHLPAHVDCTAVVKADAYGHGASETMRIALEEGYNSAAVAWHLGRMDSPALFSHWDFRFLKKQKQR